MTIATKITVQSTIFATVFLYVRLSLRPSRTLVKSSISDILFKSIGRLPIGLVTSSIQPHLYYPKTTPKIVIFTKDRLNIFFYQGPKLNNTSLDNVTSFLKPSSSFPNT